MEPPKTVSNLKQSPCVQSCGVMTPQKTMPGLKRSASAREFCVSEPPQKLGTKPNSLTGIQGSNTACTQVFRQPTGDCFAQKFSKCNCKGHLKRHPHCVFNDEQQP